MNDDDMALTLLLADFDEVMTRHHATTAQVLAAGSQLICAAGCKKMSQVLKHYI